jgi:transposase
MDAETLRDLATTLLQQLAQHQQALAEKDQALTQKDEALKLKQLKIEQLTHEMATLKQWRFGRHSERLDSGQRSLLEESIDEDLEAIGLELKELQSSPKAAQPPKDKPRRVALPAGLPRVEFNHEPEQTVCSCGCALERFDQDVSEKLDYTPGVFQVHRHVRGKRVCRHCGDFWRRCSWQSMPNADIGIERTMPHSRLCGKTSYEAAKARDLQDFSLDGVRHSLAPRKRERASSGLFDALAKNDILEVC